MHWLQCLFLSVLAEALNFEPRKSIPAGNDEPAPFQKQIDVYPETFQRPVPFGHIYKEGFEDPNAKFKAPIDTLELSMRAPQSPEEAKELLLKTNPKKIYFLRKPVNNRAFVNPRDKFLYDEGGNNAVIHPNETDISWFNLVDLQLRNLAVPPRPRPPEIRRQHLDIPPPPEPPRDVFNEFLQPTLETPTENYTTCDEFAGKETFYPKDIINFDWVPFYIWSVDIKTVAVVYKFKYATKKLVNKYREIYRKHNFRHIDWEQPKILMQYTEEVLLVAANRRGLFHALVLIKDLPPDVKLLTLPYFTIRFKIVEPYLAMMFCNDFRAQIMAVDGNIPKTDEDKTKEASALGYRGPPGNPASRLLNEERLAMQAAREAEILKKERETIKFGQPSLHIDPYDM